LATAAAERGLTVAAERSLFRSRDITSLLLSATTLPADLVALCRDYVRSAADSYCLTDRAQTPVMICVCSAAHTCAECGAHATCDNRAWAGGCTRCRYKPSRLCQTCGMRHDAVCAQEARAREESDTVFTMNMFLLLLFPVLRLDLLLNQAHPVVHIQSQELTLRAGEWSEGATTE
jgi:hypothetical protein